MDRIIEWLARVCALAGGVALVALILMTCISITGRALSGLGLGPITGDFEMLEAGIAFCIFAFIPLCTLKAGHATVDIFTNMMSDRSNRAILAFWEVIMALMVLLIAWRLYVGTGDKIRQGQTSFLLEFPIWWAYAASMVPAAVGVLVSFWSAWDRIRALVTGCDTRDIRAGGADH